MPRRFEVEPLCAQPQSIRKKQPCYALQGPDGATELQMIAALKGLSLEALPLLPSLLGPPRGALRPQGPSGQQQASSHARGLPSLRQQQQQEQPGDYLQGAEEASGEKQLQGQSSPRTQPKADQTQPSGIPYSAGGEGSDSSGGEEQSEIAESSAITSDSKEAAPAEGVEADSIIQQFGLNTEQAAALRAMEVWALPGASQVCMPGFHVWCEEASKSICLRSSVFHV